MRFREAFRNLKNEFEKKNINHKTSKKKNGTHKMENIYN